MSVDQKPYDLFLSYARLDNEPATEGWVTAIRDRIAADHRQFSTEPLRNFFDTDEIEDADDWRHRILGALRQSKILLVFLSPTYMASPYCRWEWEDYLRYGARSPFGVPRSRGCGPPEGGTPNGELRTHSSTGLAALRGRGIVAP